jgi:DNA-binding NarL/FixJ family response regulator
LTATPRVLVVVSSSAERRAISRYTQRLGLTPVEITTVAGARQLLRDPTQDLAAALVDLELEDGSGLALVPQLRIPPRPVATIITGGPEIEHAAALALALGVHRLLRKPFAPDAYESALASTRKRTAEFRRWMDPETVGERHDSWIEMLIAGGSESGEESGEESGGERPAFLDRMARVVIARGQLTPAAARLVPDLLLGRDYGSIAAVHGVSVETVRSHVKTILARLNLGSAKELWQVCVAELDG